MREGAHDCNPLAYGGAQTFFFMYPGAPGFGKREKDANRTTREKTVAIVKTITLIMTRFPLVQ